MNRRNFLAMLGLAVAAEAIPFGRVWSFPSEIIIPNDSLMNLATIYYNKAALERLEENLKFYRLNERNAFPVLGSNIITFNRYAA